MLDPQGFVATCNSVNFFIVREGEVRTYMGSTTMSSFGAAAVVLSVLPVPLAVSTWLFITPYGIQYRRSSPHVSCCSCALLWNALLKSALLIWLWGRLPWFRGLETERLVWFAVC